MSYKHKQNKYQYRPKQQARTVAIPAGNPVAKKNYNISNEVEIDVENPIPFDTGYVGFSFATGDPYIRFLPPYNNFATTLLETKMTSVTHKSCVNTKARYCAGIGFEDAEDTTEIDPRIIEWFDNVNLRNESITQVCETAFNSRFTFGNSPIELVRFTIGGVKRFMVYVHDLQEWRLGKPDVNTDMVNYAIQSYLFRKHISYMNSDALKQAKKLPIYSKWNTEKQNWKRFPDGSERTLIWDKETEVGYPYYGIPSAVVGILYQRAEYKGIRFDLDNFDNNLILGGVLALKGNISQTEADRIGKKIINTHTGDGKRGRVAVVSSQDGIDNSDFHDFNTQREGSYVEGQNGWRQSIILANDWDAVLAGLISPSTLGKGAGFLRTLIEWKLTTVIRPEQDKLMRSVLRVVFQEAQNWLNLPFEEYKWKFKNNIDISGLSEVDITPAVTPNEVRQAKGLAKKDEPYYEQPMKSGGAANTAIDNTNTDNNNTGNGQKGGNSNG